MKNQAAKTNSNLESHKQHEKIKKLAAEKIGVHESQEKIITNAINQISLVTSHPTGGRKAMSGHDKQMPAQHKWPPG